MKSIIPLTAAATAAVLTLAGCASGSSGSPEVKGAKLAFIPGVSGDSFYISMECGVREEAKKHGMEVDVQAPQQFDPSMQTPIVNAAVAKQPAALLIAPTDAKALIPPLVQAQQSDIKIGLVDTTLEDDSLAVTSVSTDNEAGGAAAADALAELVGEKGKVLVIAFKAGASTSDARQKGFEDQIKNHPDIEYIGAKVNDNDPAKAASIVSAALSANPDLTGVFATNQFAAEGAATGLRQANASGRVKIVGFDAGPVQVEQLEQGAVQALIAQKPYEIGVTAVENVVASMNGDEPESEVGTNTVTVTKDNITTPEIQEALYKTEC